MVYRVAIIGCGRMACTIDDEIDSLLGWSGITLPYTHAGGYAAVPETEMVAACDIDPQRVEGAQTRWNIPRGYTDFQECIDKERPDIISVTTRPENHAEIILYAAAHGVKGMYVEKPLCCSLEETDAIKAACDQYGVQLEFGPMRRNWAVYRQARALVDSGEYGPLRSVIGFGGNPCGGHALDTLLYLAGDPKGVAVQAILGKLSPFEGDTTGMYFKPDAPILAARITTSGVPVSVVDSGIRSGPEYEVICAEALIRIQNDGHHLVLRRLNKEHRAYEEVELPPVEHWSGTARKVAELVEAVRTGTPGVSNLHTTVNTQEIGYGMYESHLRGGVEVALPVTVRNRWVSSW